MLIVVFFYISTFHLFIFIITNFFFKLFNTIYTINANRSALKFVEITRTMELLACFIVIIILVARYSERTPPVLSRRFVKRKPVRFSSTRSSLQTTAVNYNRNHRLALEKLLLFLMLGSKSAIEVSWSYGTTTI